MVYTGFEITLFRHEIFNAEAQRIGENMIGWLYVSSEVIQQEITKSRNQRIQTNMKQNILIQDEFKIQHTPQSDDTPNLWSSIILLILIFLTPILCYATQMASDWSNFLRSIVFFSPVIIAFIVNGLRYIVKTENSSHKSSKVQRILFINPVNNSLNLSLGGNQHENLEYELHKLKKIEKIPHNWLQKHGLRFIFEDDVLEITQLSLENCDHIRLLIREYIRGDDAHQIDFEDVSGFEEQSSKS